MLHRSEVNVAGVRDSINGGVLASLAELSAHVALRTVINDGGRVARTQDLSISYTSSAGWRWSTWPSPRGMIAGSAAAL